MLGDFNKILIIAKIQITKKKNLRNEIKTMKTETILSKTLSGFTK